MQILLANAKLMHTKCSIAPSSVAEHASLAEQIAVEMATRDVDSLARDFKCSATVAAEAWGRYDQFFQAERMPALLAYNGHAYKHLRADDFTATDWQFAQQHLWITCFLYGLLRPQDGVAPYRMEHTVRLALANGQLVHSLWRKRLTDALIQAVKADDGVLLHLSTGEYEQLFDWARVCREVRVVQPLFYVRSNGKLKVQAVWAKACRGAMVRYVVKQRLTRPEDLGTFSYEGFVWAPHLGEADFPHFVRE